MYHPKVLFYFIRLNNQPPLLKLSQLVWLFLMDIILLSGFLKE